MRLKYFLAASEYFSELDCFDHDIALKLRPYGGPIGIDNSSLHKYLILHDYFARYFTRRRWFHMRNIKPRTWLFLFASVEKQQLL